MKGQNCELRMQIGDSFCLSNPCWNSGVCQDLGYDWQCICPSGTSGKDCRQISSAPCQFNNPCRNNAVCQVRPNTPTGIIRLFLFYFRYFKNVTLF